MSTGNGKKKNGNGQKAPSASRPTHEISPVDRLYHLWHESMSAKHQEYAKASAETLLDVMSHLQQEPRWNRLQKAAFLNWCDTMGILPKKTPKKEG